MQQTNHSIRPASNAFEIQVLKKEENNAPANKELFRIFWIKEGSGAMYIDMQEYAISGDTIYCIKPGQAIKFEPAKETDGYALSFSPDFLAMAVDEREPLYYSAVFHPLSPFSTIKVETRLKPEMLEVAERMIMEFSNVLPGKEEILRGMLKIFLIYLNRQGAAPPQPLVHLTQSGLASRFFSLLDKNFANRKMVSDYAQDLSVTPNYLNEIVKKASGFPASYHIRQRIILEAKRKAAYVSKSMKEIAYDLGFDDISHFSKYFKKASGVSFSDFKKEISQQFSFA